MYLAAAANSDTPGAPPLQARIQSCWWLTPRCSICDGSISVSASGGTGALQYSKDNGANWQSGATFSSLGAGGYTIQVKDDNGCTVAYASNPVNLTQPTALTASAAADTTICSGASRSEE